MSNGPSDRPLTSRPLTKICGVTRPADAVRAVESGAAMIGLNFHPPSPRSVTPGRALEIAAAVRGTDGGDAVRLVGVFVDLAVERIEAIDRGVGLDLVQLHGDPAPADAAPFADRALVVTRVPAPDPESDTAPPTAAQLTDHLAAFPDAWGFLCDVRHPELWGGSGESFAWDLLAGVDRGRLGGRPLLVAGGVTPDNAARALAESGADGVDVASGVESEPGVKDPELVARLLAEVRRAG